MEDFFLENEPFSFGSVPDDSEADGLEFFVNKPATGWTAADDAILERALNLAGISEPAERMTAAMSVDIPGIICLAPLVKSVDGGLGQIREFFERIKGGIGK